MVSTSKWNTSRSPDLEDRVLVICDPMLATGRSMVLVYQAR
jgi:uracil phosphoribosyltransferase